MTAKYVEAFRERQKAMGRKRVEYWHHEEDSKTIKKYINKKNKERELEYISED